MEVRTSVAPVWTEQFLRQMIASWTVAPLAALLDGGNVRLFKDLPAGASPKSVLADFTAEQADFTDYAAVPLALVEPVNLGQYVEGATQTAAYNMDTNPAVTSNTINGYYIEDLAGGLACYEVFDVPVEMAEFGDALSLVLQLPLMSFQTVAG